MTRTSLLNTPGSREASSDRCAGEEVEDGDEETQTHGVVDVDEACWGDYTGHELSTERVVRST